MEAMITRELPELAETVALYDAVGWTTYTTDPRMLMAALVGSHTVLTARDESGTLIGLVRTISDGHTISYVQDILVHPDHHRTGVGGALLDSVIHGATGLRLVLITDADDGQRAFYESRGFTEAHDIRPDPLRAFVRMP